MAEGGCVGGGDPKSPEHILREIVNYKVKIAYSCAYSVLYT